MSAEEFAPVDERCASLLAACHDALLAGETASHVTSPEVPPELQARLERNLACLRMLDQAWPEQTVGRRTRPARAGHTPAGASASELPTTIGRYRIRGELGRGGFGIVFQAYDPHLGREVALKVPRPEAVLTPELRERFLREARAAAVLDHPNVVPVYDAGEVGPVCYIASAYCPGTTLGAWLKARAEPVPWREAAALVATLAEAVHHAHAQGVVHRDLKPANVLLQESGDRGQESEGKDPATDSAGLAPDSGLVTRVPKITDFGLAKFQSLDPAVPAQEYPTQTGAIVGTPRYMAPEQAAGSSRAVGPAVDIHALGAMLYEVLTGRPPFVAETVLDTLEQVRKHEPVPPRRLRPKLPRDLETICLRCLQKEPSKRYASAAELAADLGRFLAGEPIRARPIPAWERVIKWTRRRPAVAALILVSSLASVLLVVGLVVWIVRERQALEASEQTAYFNGISSAEHEISTGNWGRAEELLDECPERLRGWEWHYLKRLRHTDPISLTMGKRISMTAGFDLAFHPNSSLLAIPSNGNRIQIWDISSTREQPLVSLAGHEERVLSLTFSPDGRRLASTSEDRRVKVWDVAAGLVSGELREPILTLSHKERVVGVAFSPDGQLLASVSGESAKTGEVKVWNAADGKWLFSFPGQAISNPIIHFVFSPDSRWLASGSVDNTVKIWDLATREEVYILPGHHEPILNVLFTPDGRRLVSLSQDREVKVWDLPAGKPRGLAPAGQTLVARWTWSKATNSPWCMALSPDGSRLAIGGPTADGNVRVYDMTNGELLHTLMGEYRIVSLAFSPDSRRLASAGYDRIVRLWDTASGREVLDLHGHADIMGRVLFSPDGQRLASASADGTVRVWDGNPFDENAVPHIRTLGGNDGEFFGVAFSSKDNRLLASASADNFIKLWDTETGQVIRVFPGHDEGALCVAFSPDERLLVSGGMDKSVKLWDTRTGQVLHSFHEGFALNVRSVAVQPPDGQTFATVSHQFLELWDVQTGQVRFARQADPEHLNWVAFSPDGKYVATTGHSGTAMVWDVESGKVVSSFKGHQTSVFCVAFHPTGKYLASGDSDKEIKLWAPDSPTGRPIATLRGHTDFVSNLAFSSDGRYLATASWREVKVWDTNDLEEPPKTFGRVAGRIWCLAFSPDGKRLAAASGYKGKGKIKIWESSLWKRPGVLGP
jgi:eukaryotic-like serine/threonine-protein kinase